MLQFNSFHTINQTAVFPNFHEGCFLYMSGIQHATAPVDGWNRDQPNSSGPNPTSGSNRFSPSASVSGSSVRRLRWPILRPGRGALP